MGHTNDLTWQTLTTPDVEWLDGLTPMQFFEQHVRLAGDFGCWIWTGRMGNGYGSINAGGRSHTAYRFSYVAHRGEVPPGLSLDHLCRQRTCVNPWHLEPVTPRVNISRAHGFRRRGRRVRAA